MDKYEELFEVVSYGPDQVDHVILHVFICEDCPLSELPDDQSQVLNSRHFIETVLDQNLLHLQDLAR